MQLGQTIRHGGRDYTIECEWDALVGLGDSGTLRFLVRGTVTDLESEASESVELTLEADLNAGFLVVRHEDQEIARLPLDQDLPTDEADLNPYEEDTLVWGTAETPRAYAERVAELRDAIPDVEYMDSSAAELIIQAIPVDPLLGCLLKSGVSTVIGQLIRCWRGTAEVQDAGIQMEGRIRALADCVMGHAREMGFRFMFRAGKCVFFAGLA